MSHRLQLGLLIFAPLVLVLVLMAYGLSVAMPQLGRDYVIRIALPDPDAQIGLPEIQGPQDASRPLIVIDAGHGGHDPGAGGPVMPEKTVVLGLAMALRDRLLEQGGVRVAMTRENDRFLILQDRAAIARRLGADLFLSIHADSVSDRDNTENVEGATIYTLSAKASDQAAARLAERENMADEINGIVLGGRSDAVNAILVDLAQRRVNEEAVAFAKLVLREGEGRLSFHANPRRSAAFVVLKSPDVPSVLYEAGYISNPDEARRLASPEGKAAFADVLARAVRIYFASNTGA